MQRAELRNRSFLLVLLACNCTNDQKELSSLFIFVLQTKAEAEVEALRSSVEKILGAVGGGVASMSNPASVEETTDIASKVNLLSLCKS